jgi:dihydrofolate synthase/folylpolyglutamate synthase
MMNYSEALEYIHSVSWTFCKPGLERISALCEALGNPQRDLKFIHVAGTNGKGSFCSMTDSVLRAAGYRVGLFTSPFVVRFNERMKVDGLDIPDDTLAEIVEKIKPICDAMQDKPTEFELITAIAFVYFSSQKCDFVVLECGLGGRLDSTNIIEKPILSVITGIALDHTAILGDTIEKIAYEKAGIIKGGVPVLFGGEDEVAERVIASRAREMKSPLSLSANTKCENTVFALSGTDFDFCEYKGLHINLLGKYQINNARNVLCAIKILKEQGIEIPDSAVRLGLSEAVWHARFERLSSEPLVIYDGAHNCEGVDALYRSVKEYFADAPLYCLSGTLADKDYKHTAEIISKIATRAYVITPDNPRALSAHDFAKCISSLGTEAYPFDTIAEAVKAAFNDARKAGVPLICFGSLYTYGEVAYEIEKQKNEA